MGLCAFIRGGSKRSRGFATSLVVLVLALLATGCGGADPEISASGVGAGNRVTSTVGAGAKSAKTDNQEPGKAEATASGFIGDRLSGATYQSANPTIPQEPSPFRFVDIRPESGVDFVHVSGMDEEKHFPTANGSGVGIFDYDGDGLMDLYFASCNPIPEGKERPGRNRLYRNLGDGKFEDVTDAAGLGFSGFCHGIIVGDIDNDGDPDVILANYGPNVLFVNNGDGTFTDATESAGLGHPGWSSGGAFLDHDNDGDLDLYASNYGSWTYPDDDEFCGDPTKNVRLYCSPRSIRTVQHLFYRNNGDGTFTECAEQVGLGREATQQGHGFGVVAADLDGNGLIDLYVANDMNPNFLFLNNGDGTFRDATELSGAAFDDKGNAQSGMGVDAEDVDGDGLPDLFVTNFANEYNTLYKNLGNGIFYDLTASYGLAADAMPWVGWGCGLVDFDNDGWPDAFVANGHVDNNRPGVEYEEVPLLHRNVPLGDTPDASRRFKLATRDVGPYFEGKHVARGVAFGDLDNDGDIDIVVNHKDGAPAILRNDTPSASENGWVRLDLQGTRGNPEGIGAGIEVVAGGRTIHRQRKSGTSLESSHDPRVLIGIGPVEAAESIVVRWPSGAVSTFEDVASGTTLEVREPETNDNPDASGAEATE